MTSARRRRTASTLLAAGLAAILVAGCMSSPAPSTSPPPPVSPAAPISSSSGPAPRRRRHRPRCRSPRPLHVSSSCHRWRLARSQGLEPNGAWSGVVEDPAFDEETYAIAAGCPQSRATRSTTPLGLTGPATVIQLKTKRRDVHVGGPARPADRVSRRERRPRRRRGERHVHAPSLGPGRSTGRYVGRLHQPSWGRRHRHRADADRRVGRL